MGAFENFCLSWCKGRVIFGVQEKVVLVDVRTTERCGGLAVIADESATEICKNQCIKVVHINQGLSNPEMLSFNGLGLLANLSIPKDLTYRKVTDD